MHALILCGPILDMVASSRVYSASARKPRNDVAELVDRLKDEEQVEMPLIHRFSPGIYMREIFMPAGTFVIGHIHKTRHYNIVLSGRARVMIEGEIRDIVAPCAFESGAGVQKVLYIVESMRWLTVHANPTDETDVVKLEESLVALTTEQLASKGRMDLDTLRMSVNAERKELA